MTKKLINKEIQWRCRSRGSLRRARMPQLTSDSRVGYKAVRANAGVRRDVRITVCVLWETCGRDAEYRDCNLSTRTGKMAVMRTSVRKDATTRCVGRKRTNVGSRPTHRGRERRGGPSGAANIGSATDMGREYCGRAAGSPHYSPP